MSEGLLEIMMGEWEDEEKDTAVLLNSFVRGDGGLQRVLSSSGVDSAAIDSSVWSALDSGG